MGHDLVQHVMKPETGGPRKTGRASIWFWAAYLLLLAASHAWQAARPTPPTHTAPLAQTTIDGHTHAFTCPQYDDDGDAPGPSLRVTFRQWGAGLPGEPLILIHGSPGAAGDFAKMGPLLAAQGRRVLAPDLPGFGSSTRRPVSYSTRAHARALLAMMDHLSIQRAHVVGWSMGGGVALNLADLAPERVASITMLAAIGDQAVEGSGSYAFEHAKYALGRAALLTLHATLPHFGLLPDPRATIAYATLRNFGDTDMRRLRPVMERLSTPTLIIAGRDDFLVQLGAARLHHEIIRPSRLVVMDAMHFMPFMQADETSRLIGDFITRDASSGASLARSEAWEAPQRTAPFGAVGRAGARTLELAPWWLVALLLMASAVRRPFATAAIVAALVNALHMDWGIGLFGVFLGVLTAQILSLAGGRRRREDSSQGTVHGSQQDTVVSVADWQRRFHRSPPGFWLAWRAVFRPDIVHAAPRAVGLLASPWQTARYVAGAMFASIAWTLVVVVPLLIIAALIALHLREALGWTGTLLSLLTLWLWARSFALLFTWTGRRLLLARLSRLTRHEYWPPWIYYAPLVPYLIYLALKHGHPLAFTACNPGVARGGGVIGESKHEIMELITARPRDCALLESVRIDEHESHEHRARAALEHIGPGRAVGDFPVILKPDAGLRGFGVRLAREPAHVDAYFRDMTRAAIVQRYHPGPCEVGVMWARDLAARNGQAQGRTGAIYSITRKEFPYVEGDGRRTLEQLIYRHPRHRRQAAIFLARFAADASRVIPDAERFRLAQSGNHCQGTLFRDGADLITPELSQAIDDLAASCASARAPSGGGPEGGGPSGGGPEGGGPSGGLDFGRFDLRFESDDELRDGRNFGVIELNGTSGESTNIYDPDKSLLWSYRVLFGQWRLLYELGAWRMSHGARPWTIRTLLRSLRDFYKDRPGSAIAD